MKASLLLVFVFFVAQFCAIAKNNETGWHLTCPKSNVSVSSGQLFITIRIDSNITIKTNTFKFMLDDRLITTGIKFLSKDISILYKIPIKPGKHKLHFEVKADNVGWLPDINFEFELEGSKKKENDKEYFSSLDQNLSTKKFFEMTGVLSADYRTVDITGPGKDFRQSPPYISNLNINTVTRIGQVSIPVKIFATSDEYNYQPPSIQSRNFYQVGLLYKKFEITWGDMNPNFDRLALPGSRVNGIRFAYKSKHFLFQALDGSLQRPIEGLKIKYDPNSGLPPANLRSDSTYIVPGTYKRRISAVQFGFGNRQEGFNLNLNFLKVKDDTGSIRYGLNPKDNVVVSSEQCMIAAGGKVKITSGIATSFITNSITGGPATKHQLDSALGKKYAFDPKPYTDALIINVTTGKPGWQSVSGFFNTVFRIKSQTITADYDYFGSSYSSLANPFLRNDLQIMSLQDQVAFWKRKILFTGRGTYEFNNLSGTQFSTTQSYIGYGSLFITIKPLLPQLGFNYYTQMRNAPASIAGSQSTNDQSNSFTATMLYSLSKKNVIHSINIMYNNLQRRDLNNNYNNNTTQMYNAGINEVFTSIHLSLDFRYTTMVFKNEETGSNPTSSIYDGRMRYELTKLKTYIFAGYYINDVYATGYSTASTRHSLTGGISYRGIKNTVIDFEIGHAPYNDLTYNYRNYNENYYMGRITHNLNIR